MRLLACSQKCATSALARTAQIQVPGSYGRIASWNVRDMISAVHRAPLIESREVLAKPTCGIFAEEDDSSSSGMFWIAVAASIALLACAVTGTSLWIDEGYSAWIAAHRSLPSVLQTLVIAPVSPSDRQALLNYLWLWAWTHVFGSSEYTLRAANLPFAALFVLSLALTSRCVFQRRFAWIPLSLTPFAWYYMNEARPYLMLTSFATAATAATLVYCFGPQQSRDRAVWILLAAMLCAWLTHILAALLFPGLLIIGIFAFRSGRVPQWREWRAPLLVFVPPLVVVGIYYLGTLATAHQEIKINHRQFPSLAFAAEIVYEHVGFAGLGPPRNALRISPIMSMSWSYLLWLSLGIAAVSFACYRAIRRPIDPRFQALFLAWAFSIGLATVAAFLINGRFLGRHAAALLPLLLFTALALFRSRTQWLTIALVFVVSDVRLSLLPAYGKDDYRSAVQDLIARNHVRPGFIDWAADFYTAHYYGLAVRDSSRAVEDLQRDDPSVRAHAIGAANLSPGAVTALIRHQRATGRPIYIALSKPDIFDEQLGWERAIRENHGIQLAEYRSFDIFAIGASAPP
jgi:hypothetical protein